MKAIVWTGSLEVRDDVEVRDLRANEVRVRVHATGLCHSDVSVVNGTIPFPTPAVLGHEGGTILVVLNGLRLLAFDGSDGAARTPYGLRPAVESLTHDQAV